MAEHEPQIREGTVLSRRGDHVWFRDDHGDVMRAWCPPDRQAPAANTKIRVYIGAASAPEGWYDEISGLAVNLRMFDGRSKAQAAEVVCRGACRTVWIAPAAAAIVAAGDACLHCRGELDAV